MRLIVLKLVKRVIDSEANKFRRFITENAIEDLVSPVAERYSPALRVIIFLAGVRGSWPIVVMYLVKPSPSLSLNLLISLINCSTFEIVAIDLSWCLTAMSKTVNMTAWMVLSAAPSHTSLCADSSPLEPPITCTTLRNSVLALSQSPSNA